MTETVETIMETHVQELLDANDPELSPSPDGVGLKSHIGDLFNLEHEDGTVERLFIQLYAQSQIPIKPSDIDLGYTMDDVISEHGVVLADVASRTDPPSYVGEIISENTFMENYIPDESRLRNQIEDMFETLRDLAKPKENWLEHVSSLYNDRLPGKEGAVKPRRIC